jgi:RNA polymerase sigma-70 factor (ECF subfamily)
MFGKARRLRSEFEREALPHLDALFGTAMRLTRNPRDAEDLVQDALLRAYRFWGHFEAGTNCKAWLLKILTNTFINRYHKARRDRELAQEVRHIGDDEVAETIVSAEAQAASRDPEGALVSRMLSDEVLRALDTLPTDFRLAVVLCDLEELSYKEIADVMECPVGTVMSRLFRGRRLLQKALHDYAVEQGIVKPVAAPQAAAAKPERAEADAFAGTADVVSLADYRTAAKAGGPGPGPGRGRP